ncbi:hypothetical protein OIU74_026194 [Salix koriyanagi]|uniref:Uncharacterized protein n=1 Tax=Salix koriyanagi TaxID=2511006 RepID=A0A9Q0VY64_9ROSI|nr:hypothetical protein OIU74_026194 [Salix koriyanagi]
MIEQALLQEEKRLLLDLKAKMDVREKASREAQLRMEAMVQAEQAQAKTHARAEILSLGPNEMMNGWGGNAQGDEKEPFEDFLNDEETENGGTVVRSEWREVGEFDLNTK